MSVKVLNNYSHAVVGNVALDDFPEDDFVAQDKANSFNDSEYQKMLLAISKRRSAIGKYIGAFVKRAFDIIGALVGIVLLIPLTIFVFLANKLHKEDRGPLFYVQDRIGKDGKLFKMIKFRTMCVDADEKLKKFLDENEDIRREFKIYRKIRNDPRITKIGGFLRRTSLDEWPQFINVLLGQMSLVGPRPYLPREKEDMKGYYDLITKEKPGLTGLWQTNGRSDVTFKDRLDMDIIYHENSSFIYDIKILAKTAKNVLSKEGAV